MVDVRKLNRGAWDAQVERKNPWTIPVTSEEIAAARRGQGRILLTPVKAVPSSWFPPLVGARVLCLASGGGQQGPILAAAGGNVTVLDNSPKQLAQDRMVAHREGLELELVEFGHSLEDQIGGQITAGFVITGFYEDVFPPDEDVLSRYIPSFAATRATKHPR